MGVYGMRQSAFDVFLLYAIGLLGFLMRRYGFPVAPVIVGMILGPLAEEQLRRALSISQGDWMIFLTHGISAVLLGHHGRWSCSHRSRAPVQETKARGHPELRFDRFYRYAELTESCTASPRAAGPLLGRDHRQEPRGPRHLARRPSPTRDRPRRGQARLLGRRQHPRDRGRGVRRVPLLPARRSRRSTASDADVTRAARHARLLRLPAHQSRRRRMGARRQAEVHPLLHAPLSLRRGAARRAHRRGCRRRRAHPADAHSRSERRLEGASRTSRGS